MGLIYKLNHRYIYVGKNTVFVEFSTVNIVWVLYRYTNRYMVSFNTTVIKIRELNFERSSSRTHGLRSRKIFAMLYQSHKT